MKNLLQIALATAALMAALPAQASTFTFNTVNEGKVEGAGYGNAFTYGTTTDTGDAIKMKVTAWSLGLDGKIVAGKLASWGSNGLGIYQSGERTGGGYHQIDNVGGWEFTVLQFDKAVTLTSAVLNPFQLDDRSYTDNDAYVSSANLSGAWNQAITSTTFRNLSSSLAANDMNTDSSDFADRRKQTFSGPAAGNFWIIGASINGPDKMYDAFKIAQVGGETVAAVPEPGTWAMMFVGFGAVGATLRRGKRKVAIKGTCAFA